MSDVLLTATAVPYWRRAGLRESIDQKAALRLFNTINTPPAGHLNVSNYRLQPHTVCTVLDKYETNS